MSFCTLLFPSLDNEMVHDEPAYFTDLNLDQIEHRITAGKLEYELTQFYYTPLKNADDILYRQEIMHDLEDDAVLKNIKAFEGEMRDMRMHLSLSNKLEYKYNREGWFLEAVKAYCAAVNFLARYLASAGLKSRGLIAFREYLEAYSRSERYASLLEETQKAASDLATVRYCLLKRGLSCKVSRYDSELDFSAEIEKAFEKFKQGAVKEYRAKFPADAGMNHVEARIIDLVALLYPEIFAELDGYCEKNSDFIDRSIAVFEREIQFFISYLDYIAVMKRAGLKFCYPEVSGASKEIYSREGFDLALAWKLISENSEVVTNDFYLAGAERIIVVSGPNQGGKTTFARVFGQLHHLASIGCPVPGSEARLYLFDNIFTHFEKEEDIKNLRGKLQDDLVRIHDILDKATPESIIIMNEIFTSTTLKDSIFLSKKVLERIIRLDSLCIYVTFIAELASLSERTVSMVSTIVPENPALRTYKVVRKPADGLAYAISIAEKHRLTYSCIKARIGG